jgi:hypothetical protein
MHGIKPIQILKRLINFLGFYTRDKRMMRAKVRKLPPCGDTFTNTPNNIFQRYASSSKNGLKLLLTASVSLKRRFLRDYLVIFMIAVLVLALTSWIILIIEWPIAMEFQRIFIKALITPGDSDIQTRRLRYRPESADHRGRRLRARLLGGMILRLRVRSLSLVNVMWVFSK